MQLNNYWLTWNFKNALNVQVTECFQKLLINTCFVVQSILENNDTRWIQHRQTKLKLVQLAESIRMQNCKQIFEWFSRETRRQYRRRNSTLELIHIIRKAFLIISDGYRDRAASGWNGNERTPSGLPGGCWSRFDHKYWGRSIRLKATPTRRRGAHLRFRLARTSGGFVCEGT